MKTIPFLHRSLIVVMAGLALARLPAEDKPAPAAPARTYVLFMGTDLSVQRDKRYFRVEDVSGSELVIRNGKKEFFVPTRNRQTGIKVNNSLKLSAASVQLDGLQSGPSYTPANDPMRKFIAASGAAGGAAAVRDLAWGKVIQAEIGLAAAGNSLAQTPENSSSRALVEAAYAKAQQDYSQAFGEASSANSEFQLSAENDVTAAAERMNRERDEANYDAMEVSFKISSPVPLDDPHMVILFKYQERGAKPGDVGLLIHAKTLEPIGAKPRYVRVKEGGLPKGFKYLTCEVHIYNRGEEVATNASAKRVELSREEAQQYLVIEHIGANKGATLPAVAVPGTLSSAQRSHLSLDQLNRIFYARISKSGDVLGVFSDEGCNLALEDSATLAAVREMFFKPALEQGKPVDGTARVRLGDT